MDFYNNFVTWQALFLAKGLFYVKFGVFRLDIYRKNLAKV